MYYKYIILHNNTSLFFKYQFFTLKINYKIQRNTKKYKEIQRYVKYVLNNDMNVLLILLVDNYNFVKQVQKY